MYHMSERECRGECKFTPHAPMFEYLVPVGWCCLGIHWSFGAQGLVDRCRSLGGSPWRCSPIPDPLRSQQAMPQSCHRSWSCPSCVCYSSEDEGFLTASITALLRPGRGCFHSVLQHCSRRGGGEGCFPNAAVTGKGILAIRSPEIPLSCIPQETSHKKFLGENPGGWLPLLRWGVRSSREVSRRQGL